MPGENLLLVIGINNYTCHRHKRLSNAVDDAMRFRNILCDKYGYVNAEEPMLNELATKKNIIAALTGIASSVTAEDSVVIYYAGHGYMESSADIAFWIPQDAEYGPSEYIPHSTVTDYVMGIKCRHVLLISDSCFSGAFRVVTHGVPPSLSMEELGQRKSRWMFASGGIQTVLDGDPEKGSHFSQVLCRILEHNTAPLLRAIDVFEQVTYEVDAAGRQTPHSWPIKCPQNQGGELWFQLQIPPGKPADQPVNPVITLPIPEFPPLDFYIARKVLDIENQPDPTAYFFKPETGTAYLADILQSEKRIVILGSAGSGKSIELQQLIDTLRKRESILIPGFKRFNTYIDQPIDSWISKDFDKVEENRILLLLDGLDEVPPAHFQTALRRIQEFSENYPYARIIITCRSNFYELPQQGYSGTLAGFRVFSLLDLVPRDIVAAINYHYKLDGEAFWEQVVKQNLTDLVTKPFFLGILIKRFRKYKELSGKRADIMEEALMALQVTNKEHFNNTTPPLSQSEIVRRLSKLAFIMETTGKNYLTDEEILDILDPQQREQLPYLPAFSRDPATNHWMFAHNNLQEYLVARELIDKSPDRILQLVTTQAAGTPKVKPTWVNTLSFLVSIASDKLNRDLLKWIASNDPEILVRFERERLSLDQREQLFMNIFNRYSDKELWLVSNKFTDADLARFGESEKTLRFLLNTLSSNESSEMRTMNAVRIIDNFVLARFEGAAPQVGQALTSLLFDRDFSNPNKYRIMAAIADLGLGDEPKVTAIINTYRKNKHQYIRAGLYLLLTRSDRNNDHVDVLIDGLSIGRMDDAEGQRDEVRLMDESHHFESALQKVTSPAALKKLLSALCEERYNAYFYFTDLHAVLEKLMENAAIAYQTDSTLLPVVVKLYLSTLRHHSQPQAAQFKKFFELTSTHWQAFELAWTRPIEHFENRDAITALTNQTTVSKFADAFIAGQFNQEDITQYHQIIFFNDHTSEQSLGWLAILEAAAAIRQFTLTRPVLRDWAARRKKEAQQSFDLLFDPETMLAEVRRIFTEENKMVITRNDWFDLRRDNYEWEGTDYIGSAMDLLHTSMRNTGQSMIEQIETLVRQPNYSNYQARHIAQDLKGHEKINLVVSQVQQEWIKNWSQTKGQPGETLWFFLNRFDIPLPDEKLLNFTNYYHFGENAELSKGGYLEELHRFIDPAKVKERVLLNLASEDLNAVIWTSHAAYLLRQHVISAYPEILRQLTTSSRSEYKYADLLALWYETTSDHEKMVQFVRETMSDDLRWRGIHWLEKTQKQTDFLKSYLTGWMNDEQKDLNDRYYAANHLIALGQLEGFTFIATGFLQAPSPDVEFRRKFYNLPSLTDTSAIDLLIKLLFIGKQPEYKKDHFDDLETLVLDALYKIGTQSLENFKEVKTALEKFEETHRDTLPNLQFLEYRIKGMEDQLSLLSANNYSITQALDEYDRLRK